MLILILFCLLKILEWRGMQNDSREFQTLPHALILKFGRVDLGYCGRLEVDLGSPYYS